MIAEVSQTPMRALIAEAVNLIVSIVRTDTAPGRRIHEVVAVEGFGDGDYRFVSMEQPA
jgi:type IV secretion system protein VirB11